MKGNVFYGLMVGVAAMAASSYSLAADGNMDLLLTGPVENIDLATHQVTVLGQRFATSDDANLVLGEPVNVYGSLEADGTIADAVVEPRSTKGANYVAGADTVYLKGVVKTTDGSVGQLSVGDSVVDYTSLLASEGFAAPQAGDVVELSGTQPVANGVVLANAAGSNAVVAATGAFKVAISSGSGLKRAISSGSGVSREISSGSGVNRNISSGSGVNRNISSGSGVNRNISSGSGVNRNISSGSGINRNISSGSGVNRNISSGSGINRDISSGSGVNRNISSGSGIHRAISSGSGVTRAISSGSGIHRQ